MFWTKDISCKVYQIKYYYNSKTTVWRLSPFENDNQIINYYFNTFNK